MAIHSVRFFLRASPLEIKTTISIHIMPSYKSNIYGCMSDIHIYYITFQQSKKYYSFKDSSNNHTSNLLTLYPNINL